MNGDVHDRMIGAAFGGSAPGLFGGVREPAMGMFNTGSPVLDMFGNMATAPMFQKLGMMPGELISTQNFYDATQARLYWQQRQVAQKEASSADQATYVRMLRGVAKMAGQEWTPDVAKAAGDLAGGMSQMSPFLQAFLGPDMLDQMHGSRGSASVMSSFLHKAGQSMVDPESGLTGLSGKSAGRMAAEIHKRFFGDKADLGSWRGFGAGRVGMMVDELNQRGLLDRSASLLTGSDRYAEMTNDSARSVGVAAEIRRAAPGVHGDLMKSIGAAGLPADQQDGRLAGNRKVLMDALEKIDRDMPEVGADIRQKFDVDRIAKRAKDMAGVVAGVREIFGDMGRPNAPMRELIAGLDRMTQGGLDTMSADQMRMSVRKTQALASLSGMGPENFMAMLGRGGALAQQLGVEQQFAVEATQGAAAFGAGFGHSGIAATPHFQARSREAMTMLDQELRMQAASSGAANQLAASVRLADAGAAGGEGLTGEAGDFVRAVKAGQKTFGPNGRSVFMSEGEWRAMMKAGGADDATLTMFASQDDANRAATSKFGIAGLVRDGAQADERRRYVAQAQAGSVSSLLSRAGVAGDRAAAIVDKTSDEVAASLQAGQYKDAAGKDVKFNLRDDGARTRAVATLLERSLKDQGVDVEALKKSSPSAFLAAAEGGFGALQQLVKGHPGLSGYGSGLAMLEVDNPEVAKRREAVSQEAAAQAIVRDSMSKLEGGNPLTRLANLLQAPPDAAGKAVGGILGGVDVKAVRERIKEMKGMSAEQLAEAGLKDRGKLDAMLDELSKAADEFDKAGPGPDGAAAVDVAKLRESAKKIVGEDKSGPGAKADPAAPGKVAAAEPDVSGSKDVQRIIGTLEIVGDKGKMSARVMGADAGAAPVMPS